MKCPSVYDLSSPAWHLKVKYSPCYSKKKKKKISKNSDAQNSLMVLILTWLADNGARFEVQHQCDVGNVCRVEDLCSVGKVNSPQFGCGVQHINPTTLTASHFGTKALSNQVAGVADSPIACLRLSSGLNFDRHHGIMTQEDNDNIPFLDELGVFHKTHEAQLGFNFSEKCGLGWLNYTGLS